MRDFYQKIAFDWASRCFGEKATANTRERARRVLEEALELAQSEGVDREQAVKILDYVFARPPGDPEQEAGGVGVTMLVYCEARGFSADRLEHRELFRVLGKPADHFRERQDKKNLAGI